MPFSSKTLPTYIQCTAYVTNYPFPAFALSKRHAGRMATSLRVIYANAPWRELTMGPQIDQPLSDTLLEAFYDEEDGRSSIKEAKRFGEWVENLHLPRVESVHTGYLRPSWLPDDEPPVQLDFVRTDIDKFYVITTVPRTPLPKYSPETDKSSLPEPPTSSITAIKREASSALKLKDFPSNQFPRRFTPNASPTTVNAASVVPERPLEAPIPNDSEMKRMVENYPWHTTSLGPRSSWPASLNTSLSYVLNCPYKAALWWGPEMILFYNDAYAAMAGVKHPGTFAQKGSVAWAEIWNAIGPLAESVMRGNSVAKQDDLLFMDKLTDARLPEETYHSWSWIPVLQEDGTWGGCINVTFETTDKVISARRFHTLREFGDKAAVATTTTQYAKACMEAFQSNIQDIPFAAIYLTTADATGKTHVPYGPPADGEGEGQPLRVSIKLAGSIGIPEDNTTAMRYMELLLDPETLDPVPVSSLIKKGRNLISPANLPSTRHINPTEKPGYLDTPDALGSQKGSSTLGDTISPSSTERHPFTYQSPSVYSESSTIKQRSSNTPADQINSDSPGSEHGAPSQTSTQTETAGRAASVSTSYWTAKSQMSPKSGPSEIGFKGSSEGRSFHSDPGHDAPSEDEPFGEVGAIAIEPPGALWPYSQVFKSKKATLYPITPEHAAHFEKRGWQDTVRECVVIPIYGEDEEIPSAVVVMAVNTRRPFDQSYRTWVEILRSSMSASLTAVQGREAEIKRAEALASLDKAKTTFFSSASHELRTPLTLIAGPIEEAIALTSENKVKDMLKLVTRNVTRLGRLVDSLMQFSRIEAGRLQGKFKLLELGALTADLATLFRNAIEKGQIEYIIECETTEVPATYVDVDFWEKIVFNLIGNAFKYTMAGTIFVETRYTRTHFEFIVRDTGVGIPAGDLQKVFERFHRVESVSRSHEGTGIGLSLTKELVGLHGGTISVTSKHGTGDSEHGSTFVVSIPLGKDHLPRDCIDDGSIPDGPFARRSYAKGYVEEATQWNFSKLPNEETTPSESSDSATSDGTRSSDLSSMYQFRKSDLVLLVDDNGDIRKFIRAIFDKYCKVVEAADGEEAMKKILAKRPDLIISDVMMPHVDGMELLNRIKTHPDPKVAQIPVILLSAKAGDEARVDGLLSGADDYISKPFRGRELVARAHLQIQLGKKKAELQSLYDSRKAELQLLMDMSPVGIFRMDSKAQMTYVNKRLLNITGPLVSSWIESRTGRVSPDERIKPPNLEEWLTNIYEDYVQETNALCNDVLMHGESGSLEIRWKNDKWTKIQVEPIGDGLIGTVTDVSDRHLYEEAQISRAKEKEALAKQRAFEAEEREREADQRRRAQELLVDVTSHELRQPVSAILNCSALVRSNLGSLYDKLLKCFEETLPFMPTRVLLGVMDEDLEALDAIYQCGLAQERIANDVLSLSRLQLQILSIHPVDFNLALEVRRILSIFSNELKMKKIEMSVSFGRSLERFEITHVSADKARFAQVVTNLLSNAIKFTDTSPPPDRRIHVYVDVSPRPPASIQCVPPVLNDNEVEQAVARFKEEPWADVYIYVAVSDSGPGLKRSDLALLFQRFQQGSNSDNVFGGSGLGLFVSRKLCDLMGGNIDVDSVYGQGATFRFYICAKVAPLPAPAQPVAIPSGQVGSHEERDSGATASPNSESAVTGLVTARIEAVRRQQQEVLENMAPPTQTQFHVLITEDNIINQTVLNRQLKKAGFKTAVASNGKQAIEQVLKLQKKGEDEGERRGYRFDCILMDCEMPVMDGLTATREIRRLEISGELTGKNRIIALTGNARSGQVDSALASGMDMVLIKPYKLDELIQAIRDSTA
ncbi:hypothetical protein FRC02_010513 [Tulasnella sp. 418]|nr:hypothetical protein FRC02_010513 [Tulasnella sp. 418]